MTPKVMATPLISGGNVSVTRASFTGQESIPDSRNPLRPKPAAAKSHFCDNHPQNFPFLPGCGRRITDLASRDHFSCLQFEGHCDSGIAVDASLRPSLDEGFTTKRTTSSRGSDASSGVSGRQKKSPGWRPEDFVK